MRDFLYQPLLRLIIGFAALFLGLFFLGVIGRYTMPMGSTRILLGVLFIAYGAFNLALGIYRLAKRKT